MDYIFLVLFAIFGFMINRFFLRLKKKVDDIDSKLDYLIHDKHFEDSLRENHKLGELLTGNDSKDM